jgi:multiple sugar transport system substrate-binding protein
LISDLNCGIEYGEDEIFKHLLDLTCIDENFFAVPFMHSSQICYINKTYVEKLGYEIPDVLTWNFILEVSSAAIKKDSESGLYEINNGKTMIPISCKNPSDLILGLLNENGVNSIFDKENSEFNDTARQVFSYIEDMISKGLLTTFAQSGYPSNLFVEGKCIFAFDSSAESTWFGTDAPNSDVLERIDFKTVVRNIPCKSFQHLTNYEQGLYFCAINNNNADKIFATWLFTKFLLSEDVQIAFSQTEGYLPSSSAIISSERFKEYITKSGLNNNLYYEVKIDSLKELQESIFNSKLCDKKTEDIYSWLINTICRDVKNGKILDDTYYQNLFETLKNLYKI